MTFDYKSKLPCDHHNDAPSPNAKYKTKTNKTKNENKNSTQKQNQTKIKTKIQCKNKTKQKRTKQNAGDPSKKDFYSKESNRKTWRQIGFKTKKKIILGVGPLSRNP